MDRGLVRALRSMGLDVVTVAEVGKRRVPDEELLRFATQESRALYTSNVGDFTRLHVSCLRRGLHHAGIIVLANQLTDIGTQVAGLVRLATTLDPDTTACADDQ